MALAVSVVALVALAACREEVVIVGAEDFRKLAGERTGQTLVEAMQQSPHRSVNIEPPRSRMRVRDVDL